MTSAYRKATTCRKAKYQKHNKKGNAGDDTTTTKNTTNTGSSFPMFENARATKCGRPEINSTPDTVIAPFEIGARTFTRFSLTCTPSDGDGDSVAGKLEFARALAIEGDIGSKTVEKIKEAVASTVDNETLGGDLRHITYVQRLLGNLTLSIVHGCHNGSAESYCIRGITAGIDEVKPVYNWNPKGLSGIPAFGKDEILLGEKFRLIEEKARDENLIIISIRDRGNLLEGYLSVDDAYAAQKLADKMLWRITWSLVSVEDRELLERLLRTQGQAP